MTHPYYPIFHYFKGLGINFTDKKILDFGSNRGNLLKSSEGKIQEKNYTGIDVDLTAIELGRSEFPTAQWIHYNRHNPVYNKFGDTSLLPPIVESYDLIIANSVFTHTTLEELIMLVTKLSEHLTTGGSLWFSWCNIDYKPCFKWFENLRLSKFESCDVPQSDTYSYLCDNRVQDKVTLENNYFVGFFNETFLLEELKDLNPINHKAYSPWIMDCIEIKKEK